MLKQIQKIPAGTFLVPMLVSAILFTFVPDLFRIGGMTETLFGGTGLLTIVAAICFCSGTGIDIKKLPYLFKRQGVLLLVHMVLCAALGLGYFYLFGNQGILGISALAFIIGISSMNPAVYLSLIQDFGTQEDEAAFGIVGLYAIAFFPMLVYSFTGSGNIDWLPVWSTLIPVLAGAVLGNIDPNIARFFTPAIPGLTSLMGWALGQGMNLIDAMEGGLGGLILIIFFYVISSSYFFIDRDVLKNDGIVGLSMINTAGLSVSSVAIIAQSYPEVVPYVTSAQAQVMMLAVATSFITPVIVKRYVSGRKAG